MNIFYYYYPFHSLDTTNHVYESRIKVTFLRPSHIDIFVVVMLSVKALLVQRDH